MASDQRITEAEEIGAVACALLGLGYLAGWAVFGDAFLTALGALR